MRNGNWCIILYSWPFAFLRSYRTYEEWKLYIGLEMKDSGLKVLTVPMRNGNSFAILVSILSWSRFLPYLWGMETWMQIVDCNEREIVLTVPMRNGNTASTLEDVEAFFVLTVPMRNGNFFVYWSDFLVNCVLTVPMRNGNVHRLFWIVLRQKVLTVPMRNGNLCHILHPLWKWLSSYRTYEEWKPFQPLSQTQSHASVLTVPMRNGNPPNSLNIAQRHL